MHAYMSSFVSTNMSMFLSLMVTWKFWKHVSKWFCSSHEVSLQKAFLSLSFLHQNNHIEYDKFLSMSHLVIRYTKHIVMDGIFFYIIKNILSSISISGFESFWKINIVRIFYSSSSSPFISKSVKDFIIIPYNVIRNHSEGTKYET